MAEEKYNGISTEAVKAKTGKDWHEWFKILDKEKGQQLTHKQIALLLGDKYKVPAWWRQMVTVGYEQAKGRRVKNQRPGGAYSVDASKVFETPVNELYSAIAEEAKRKKWLKGKFEIRKATLNKGIRTDFNGETANLNFLFCAKGERKSQVVATENKLKDAAQVETRRAFWKASLEKLGAVLKK